MGNNPCPLFFIKELKEKNKMESSNKYCNVNIMDAITAQAEE